MSLCHKYIDNGGITMLYLTLIKNRLSTGAIAPYLPKTLLDGSLSYEQFIKALAYGSTATIADVKAVLENVERVCIDTLSQGRSVNLGFCILKPQVKGIFLHPEDNFNSERNWIEVSISPNPSFQRKVTLGVKLQKVSQLKPIPTLVSLENHSTGISELITTGNLLTLHGENLKFDKSNSQLGLFFVKEDLEISVLEYSKISGKIISFKVPNGLVSGEEYQLRLRCSFGQDTRTGELDYKVRAA